MDASANMELCEMADKVNSKESFLRFVEALARDAEAVNTASGRTADGKTDLNPNGWENGSIAAFLDAMSAWAAATHGLNGEPMVSEQASWRSFARILHAGKFYE